MRREGDRQTDRQMPGRPKLTWGRAWNKLNAVTAYQTLMFLFVIFGWYVPHWAFHIFVHAYKWDFLICPVHKKCLLPQKQTQKDRNLFDRNWTFFGSLSLSIKQVSWLTDQHACSLPSHTGLYNGLVRSTPCLQWPDRSGLSPDSLFQTEPQIPSGT